MKGSPGCFDRSTGAPGPLWTQWLTREWPSKQGTEPRLSHCLDHSLGGQYIWAIGLTHDFRHTHDEATTTCPCFWTVNTRCHREGETKHCSTKICLDFIAFSIMPDARCLYIWLHTQGRSLPFVNSLHQVAQYSTTLRRNALIMKTAKNGSSLKSMMKLKSKVISMFSCYFS
jgi:hypothetical protein